MCAADSDQHSWSKPMLNVKESVLNVMWDNYLSTLVLAMIMILGLISSRKEIFQFSAKLLAGIVLVHKFMEAVESFIARFEVDRGNASTVHSVLFNCLYEDAPLTSGNDP